MVDEKSIAVMSEEMVEDSPYDPLGGLLRAQGDRPATMTDMSLLKLSPYQRALLIMDGTVTRLIEAFMMEPLEIKQIRQGIQPLVYDHPWLELGAGEQVVSRQVVLRGVESASIYAYASSELVIGRLPENVRRGLEIDGEGLGRLLLASKTEQHREILWWGKERLSELPEPVAHLNGEDFLSRTYRIIIARRPTMLISEWFPLSGNARIKPIESGGPKEGVSEEDGYEQPTD